MAQFSVEILDEHVETVIASICGMYDYDSYLETTEDSPAMTPAQFANFIVRRYITEVTTAYAVKQAESALEEARQSVADITITDPNQ